MMNNTEVNAPLGINRYGDEEGSSGSSTAESDDDDELRMCSVKSARSAERDRDFWGTDLRAMVVGLLLLLVLWNSRCFHGDQHQQQQPSEAEEIEDRFARMPIKRRTAMKSINGVADEQ